MKISVIVTSYNQADLLKEAIDSILCQSLSAHEIIICDDASSDASAELINSYQIRYPDKIKGYYHSKNVGVANNRNFGIKQSSGEYVTWLDGDDIYRYHKLEQESNALLKGNKVKWAYSQVLEVDQRQMRFLARHPHQLEGNIFDYVVSSLGSAPKNPLVEKSVFNTIGYFDCDLGIYEDYDFVLRLASNYMCKYCCNPGMEYRINTNGLSSADPSKHLDHINKIAKKFQLYLEGGLVYKQKDYQKAFMNSMKVVSARTKGMIKDRRLIAAIPLLIWLYGKKSIYHLKRFRNNIERL